MVESLCVKYDQDCETVKRIIHCESGWKIEALNSNAVVGKDIGLFQINTYYHEATAQKMGLDIKTWQGNLEYGFYLLKVQGTRPWNWSKHCWKY